MEIVWNSYIGKAIVTGSLVFMIGIIGGGINSGSGFFRFLRYLGLGAMVCSLMVTFWVAK